MQNFIEDLRQRNALFDLTNEQGILQLPKGTSFYLGIDPTSPFLHIGNFVPMISMIRIARYGLNPIFLFGGATGAIGDPSGRSAERTLLSREEINTNVESHKKTVEKIFKRAGCKVEFVNNFDWTKDVTVLDFLRDTGKHFSLSYILSKESVKTRFDTVGISFTEMSYMLLQAFDFYHLFKQKNCRMQVGGSDQFGNITAGLELIRKKVAHDRLAQGISGDDKRDEADEAFALSFPLLTDSQGKKFGKTTGSAAWLNAEATSPYKFHQFWLNTADADIEKYFMYFSLRNISEIKEILIENSKAPGKRHAQNLLADEMCTLVHDENATSEAKKCAQALFGGEIKQLTVNQLEDIFSDVPSVSISAQEIEIATDGESKLQIIDLFVKSGLAKSKGDARRLITDGGAYLNNERVTDANLTISRQIFIEGKFGILRAGKKNYAVVKIS